ncbi:ankyrin repeat-containing domain protein, partial [Ilyonectria destructans]
LDRGANTEAADTLGRTPLWWAANGGHEAIVELLLDTGKVDVNARDTEYGETPLWWAAQGEHTAVVELLRHYPC